MKKTTINKIICYLCLILLSTNIYASSSSKLHYSTIPVHHLQYKIISYVSDLFDFNNLITKKEFDNTEKLNQNEKTANIEIANSNMFACTVNISSSEGLTICSGTSVTFNISSIDDSSDITYQWQISTDSGTNWNNIGTETASSYTTSGLNHLEEIRLEITTGASGTCPNTVIYSNEIPITVNPQVELDYTINGSTNVCIGSDATFSVTINSGGGGGTISYQWIKSTDGINWTNETGAITDTHTYTGLNNNDQIDVLVSTSVDCRFTIQDPQIITINPLPTVDAGSDISVCLNGTLNLSASSTAASSWSWTGPNSFTSSNQNPSISNITNAAAGTYTLTVTDNNGCENSDTVDVTVDPLPTVNAGSDTSVCLNGTLNLSASSATATSWSWTGPNSFISSSQTPSINNVTNAAAGTYTLTVADNNGCENSDTVDVTIDPLPSVNAGIDISVCLNGTLNLSASSATSWSWTGPNSFTSLSQNPSISNITNAAAGTYTLTVTDNNGCENSDTVDVTVDPLLAPDVSIMSNDPDNNICSGDSVTFTASPTNGGLSPTYQWYIDGVPSGGSTTSNTFMPTLNATSTVSVIMTTTETCYTTLTDTSNDIIINTFTTLGAPTNLVGTSFVICPTSTETFTVDDDPNVLTYTWSFPSSHYTIISDPNSHSVTVDIASGAIAGDVSVTASNPCTPTSAATISPINIGDVTADAGIDQYVCSGTNPIQLSGEIDGVNPRKYGSTGNGEWYWSSSVGGTFTGTGGGNKDFENAIYTIPNSVNAGDVITLTLQTINPTGNGCSSGAIDTMQIFILNDPSASISISGASPICEGEDSQIQISASAFPGQEVQVTYTVAGSSDTINLTMNGTPGTDTVGSASQTIDLNGLNVDTIVQLQNIEYVNVENCPTDLTSVPSVTIVVHEPIIVEAGSDLEACQSDSPTAITLSGASFSGEADEAIWTHDGTGSLSNNDGSDPSNATYTPGNDEVGTVILTLTSNATGACPIANDTRNLVISAKVTVNPGTYESICSDGSISLNGSISGGINSGSWSGGSGTFGNSNNLSTTYTPSSDEISTGDVELTLTSDNPTGPCDAVSVPVTIVIEQKATINAGNDANVCSDNTISVSGTFGGGATGANWTAPTGSFSNVQISGNTVSADYQPTITSGDVILTLTTTGSTNPPCTEVNDTVTISVSEKSDVNAGPDITICEGEEATMAAILEGAEHSGTWSSSGSGVFNNDSATAKYTPGTQDINDGFVDLTYTYSTNNPNNPCTESFDSLRLYINPLATVNAGSDQTICSNEIATLNAVIGGGASSGTWTTSGNGSFNNNNIDAEYTPGSNDINNGSVTLTYTTDNPTGPCDSVNDSILLTIREQLVITDEPSNIGVCASQYASFYFGVTGDDVTYQWYKGSVAPGNEVTNSPPQIEGANSATLEFNQASTGDAGVYIVEVTSSFCGSVQSQPRTLSVNEVIVITDQPDDATLCEDSLVTFDVATTGTTSGYQWYKGTPSSGTIVSNSANITGANSNSLSFNQVQVGDAGNYYVVISSPPGTCSDVTSAIAVLTVTQEPSVDISYIGTPFCDSETTDQSVTFTNGMHAYTGGTFSYVVDSGGPTLDLNTTTGAITPGTSSEGTYTVTYTIPATGGCGTETATTIVSITALPVASISYSNTAYCESDSNTYDDSLTGSNNGGGTYSSSPSGLTINATSGVITPNTSSLGNYTISYTIASANGCPDVIATFDVEIQAEPDATFSFAATDYCSNNTDPIPTVTQSGGDFIASPGGLVINASTGEVDLSASTPNSYTIYYTFAAANGGCAQVQESQTLNINALPVASISYSSAAYCETDANNYSVSLSGSNNGGGSYTISPNTGLTMNASGQISPNGATVGDYTISYTIPASGGCTEVIATTVVSISAQPVGEFEYASAEFCSNDLDPAISYLNGGVQGTLTFSPAGLVMDANGLIDLDASTPGINYTITNTIAGGSTGCTDVIETFSVYIEEYISGGVVLLGNAEDDDADGDNTDDTDTDSNQIIACHQGTGEIYLPNTINPAHVVRWEYSIDNGANWIQDGNANSLTYQFSGITGLTAYRAVLDGDVSSTACGPAYSAYAFVSVIPYDLKPQPVSVTEDEFCMGGTSQFSSTIDVGGDELNADGGFQTGQLNPNDPDSWLIDGAIRGWTASGNNTKANQWSGTNPHSFNGTTYNSGDPKFGITFGDDINNQDNDPIYYWDNPYDVPDLGSVISTSVETPRFSLLGIQNPTFEFDEAYQLFNGGGAIIEISLDGGATYIQIPDDLINGDDRTSSILQSDGSTSIQSGNYTDFGNGTNHTIIDLSPYFGNTDIRIRLTMVREASSVWAVDNFALPGNNGDAQVQWTDQFDNVLNPILGTDDVIVEPITPGNQTFTVTSYINGCRSIAPDGSTDIKLEVHYANAGFDAHVDASECGSSVNLHAYDNNKTPLQNYIDFSNAGIWQDSLFQIIDGDNNLAWDPSTAIDIGKHGQEILDINGVGTGEYIYSSTYYDGSDGVLPAGDYRDYGSTTATQYWTIATGPPGFDVAAANLNLVNYFSDVNDPQAEFFGPGGDYSLRWNIEGTGSINCFDDVAVTLSSCATLDFDGLDDNVTFRNDFDLDNGAFSIEIWVKPDSEQNLGGPNNGIQTILSKRDQTALTDGYDLRLVNNKISFNWNNGNSFTHSNTISTNRWYHVAVTFDGSNSYKMYIDGIELGSTTGVAPINNNFECIMGAMDRSAAGGNPTPINYYSGWTDELRFWNVALSEEQIRQMMNQEIEDNGGNVIGRIVPMNVPNLTWANLDGYFRMNQPGDIVDGYVVANAGTRDGQMRNITTWQAETAPIPYTTDEPGDWNDVNIANNNAASPWTWGHSVWDHPNAKGIDGTTDIDWNIVQINHNVISGRTQHSSAPDKDLTVLGLLVSAGELTITDDSQTQDETNFGQGLWITHYLDLDGSIDLVGESQLVQKVYNNNPDQVTESILQVNSAGFLERDQQGYLNLFNYNHWASPVSSWPNTSANNAAYTIGNVLFDGSLSSNPLPITWLVGENIPAVAGSGPCSPISTSLYCQMRYSTYGLGGDGNTPIGLNTYWQYVYINRPADDYYQWVHVGPTGTVPVGNGYTLKGSGAGQISGIPTSYPVETPTDPQETQNYVFIGKPHNNTITLQVGPNNSALIGNPYPSAFDAKEFIKDNITNLSPSSNPGTTGSITGDLFFWEHYVENNEHVTLNYEGGYAVLNLTGGIISVSHPIISGSGTANDTPEYNIPVGQGFFVDGPPGTDQQSTNVQFYNKHRLFKREITTGGAPWDGSVFIRSSGKDKNPQPTEPEEDLLKRIRIDFTSPQGDVRHLLLGFVPNVATDGFDYGYDAKNNETLPDDLSWIIEDDKYVIQGVDDFDESKQYPLGIFLSNTGNIEIELTALENMSPNTKVYIYDALLGTYTKINNNNYEFTLDAGDYLNRFYVTFKKDKNSKDEEDEILDEVDYVIANYLNDTQEIYIKTPIDINVNQVYLINILGQSVRSWNITNTPMSHEFRIPVKNISDGNYILKVETSASSINKKVLIKR